MISAVSKAIITNSFKSKLQNNVLKNSVNISIRTNNNNNNNNARHLSTTTTTTTTTKIEINSNKIEMSTSKLTKGDNVTKMSACGPLEEDDDDLEELEDMFIMGPAGMEWNGPTRGGMK
jgi:hypothetical protein